MYRIFLPTSMNRFIAVPRNIDEEINFEWSLKPRISTVYRNFHQVNICSVDESLQAGSFFDEVTVSISATYYYDQMECACGFRDTRRTDCLCDFQMRMPNLYRLLKDKQNEFSHDLIRFLAGYLRSPCILYVEEQSIRSRICEEDVMLVSANIQQLLRVILWIQKHRAYRLLSCPTRKFTQAMVSTNNQSLQNRAPVCLYRTISDVYRHEDRSNFTFKFDRSDRLF